MLRLQNIEKSYEMGETTVFALRGVSLTIEKGDFVAIMGPSGSGKSTLMHILGLLDIPTSGSYQVEGKEVSKLEGDQLAVLRREVIGFIFQQFNLLPRMSALENVALPQLYSQKQMDLVRGAELLKKVGLESRADHKPNELSGGQQQRVAIARSLINRPTMILADEPTGNLDSTSEKEILGVLRELNEQGITVIIVTHEEEIGQQAKRLIRMRDGVIHSDERLKEYRPALAIEKKQPKKNEANFRLFDFLEYFKQGYKTLAANKVRTALSMLGIMIGVAAVVAMLAIGSGAQKAIEDQLSSLGSNLLILRPGNVRYGGVSQGSVASPRMSMADYQALKNSVSGVKASSPSVSSKAQVTFLNANWSTQVQGVEPAYFGMRGFEPKVGRTFTSDENIQRSRVALIGATVVREIFAGQNPVGEMIKINKVNFIVIGVLPEKGATGWRDQDDIILVPVLTAMYRLMGRSYIDNVEFQIDDVAKMDAAQDEILSIMNTRRRVPPEKQEEAYQVRNMADLQAALSESSKTMSLLLSSIAAISLLVGGIGIMNIMLVSVTERTREIGLRKAIGARSWDILSQFLAEAVVVSAIGGLFGIALGWLITVTVSTFAGWTTSISLSAVLLSFFFSAGIGIIFGIYPARKASLLHPIDALRHE